MRSKTSLRMAGLIPILLWALSAYPPAASAGALVERTVAFVNKRPVLLSDVELTRTLLGIDGPEALEQTIDEVLMFEEASRLLSEPAAAETVESAVRALREKAGHGFTEAALRRKARVQLAIANYIQIRLRPLVRVDDAEVRKVFNDRLANAALPEAFSVIAPEIREQLERRALDQRIEEWVTSLRRREEVRRPPPR